MTLSHFARARVTELIARAARCPVAVIAAPAGFGKSVAVRDYLETAASTTVRYDVRPEDATLLALSRGLCGALSNVAPTVSAAYVTAQSSALAASDPAIELADWLSEHINKLDCALVVDDLHHASTDPQAMRFIVSLVERTCRAVRWVIVTRTEAALPVASWVAYGTMELPIGDRELRFTVDEACGAAEALNVAFDPQDIASLCDLTGGWPVAIAIALRTRTTSADLRTATLGGLSFETRDILYRYLAEQVWSTLTAVQREFLLRTCVLSVFDLATAGALGGNAALLRELRRNIAFLSPLAGDTFRYHDLFREFLESELRAAGERAWHGAVVASGFALESSGDAIAALEQYLKVRSIRNVLRMLELHGLSLVERGHAEIVAHALEIIPDRARRRSATALGIRAILDADRGYFDVAEREFQAAIAQADEIDLRRRLTLRYAIELVRNERDCAELLEPLARENAIQPILRVPLMGTLATSYVRAQRTEDAVETIESALHLADSAAGDEARARVYQQAAYVYQYVPKRDHALRYAEVSVDLAIACGLFDVAARAYSVMYAVVKDETDDPVAALAILDRLRVCARKGGSAQAHIFGLIAAYEIAVERADDDAIEALEREWTVQRSALPRIRAEALVPADALRAAWRGEFRYAYELLAGSAQTQSSTERQALRHAEIALYAAASGEQEACERELRATATALERCASPSPRTIRARLVSALAKLVRGHTALAHRDLSIAERELRPEMRRLRALTHAVRVLQRVGTSLEERSALDDALEWLSSEQHGGFVRLLRALPIAEAEAGGVTLLTGTEQEILKLLVGGASTKEIVSRTGRNHYTVDTHIRSICRKLQCGSRREAVALAIRVGWI